MRSFILLAVLCLAGLAPRLARAQVGSQGVLEGRIVAGDSLTPIEGATVVVTDENGGPVVASGTTDGNGQSSSGPASSRRFPTATGR
jgi:hypothetical protein